MQNVNEEKRGNPLLRPFRWLFAKRRRWIPAAIILVFVILPYLAYGIFALYRYIDLTLDDIHYQKGEEAKIEQLRNDLQNNQEKWQLNNTSNYKFNLELYFGGHMMWEGFGGISSGANEVRSLTIEVNLNHTTKVFDNDLNEPNMSKEYQYCDSISDLFVIIEDTLNHRSNPAIDPETYSVEISPVLFKTTDQILVHAEFNEEYGYPEVISTYLFFGNHEYFERFYIVSFELSRFMFIE